MNVWDPAVRILHWSLVAGFSAAWFTRNGGGALHEWLGYAVMAIVFARLIWGFVGSEYALFRQFLRPVPHSISYARSVLSGNQPRYIGHNPLGAWMAVALLVFVLATCASGWLYTTDTYWGVEWVEELHDGLTTATLVLVAIHVTGVVATSLHDRENLVVSMIHGRKRAPLDDDVR
jgi:cytochrome b